MDKTCQPWYVYVNTSTCQTHLSLAILRLNYNDLMEQLVCSVSSNICMLHRCENFPSKSALESFMGNKFDVLILMEMNNIFYTVGKHRVSLCLYFLYPEMLYMTLIIVFYRYCHSCFETLIRTCQMSEIMYNRFHESL